MNLSFIKLDINIMNDSKIKFIRKMPDGDKIMVLWIGILCLAMKANEPGIVEIGDGIPFTAETLSTELDIQLNTVKLGLETFSKFKMIEIWENKEIFIVNFEKHQALDKIRKAKEKSRVTSKNHRAKIKRISAVTVTQSSRDGHVTDSDKTDKERDVEPEQSKNIHQNQATNNNSLYKTRTCARVDEISKCPGCGDVVSVDDFQCPHCGEVLEAQLDEF